MAKAFGWDEASRKLNNVATGLPDKIEIVLDSAAEVFKDAAKAGAPRSIDSVRGHNYAASIQILLREKGRRIVGSTMNVIALSTGKMYNLGEILEMGSRAHVIRAVIASTLFWMKNGVAHFALEVQHPGTRPHPHFQPAVAVVREKFPNIFFNITKVLWE